MYHMIVFAGQIRSMMQLVLCLKQWNFIYLYIYIYAYQLQGICQFCLGPLTYLLSKTVLYILFCLPVC